MTEKNLARGDRVYYLYTNTKGIQVKFAAVVLGCEPGGVMIRVGRYDVHSKEISTFESMVDAACLQPRSIACGYEDELVSAK